MDDDLYAHMSAQMRAWVKASVNHRGELVSSENWFMPDPHTIYYLGYDAGEAATGANQESVERLRLAAQFAFRELNLVLGGAIEAGRTERVRDALRDALRDLEASARAAGAG